MLVQDQDLYTLHRLGRSHNDSAEGRRHHAVPRCAKTTEPYGCGKGQQHQRTPRPIGNNALVRHFEYTVRTELRLARFGYSRNPPLAPPLLGERPGRNGFPPVFGRGWLMTELMSAREG